MSDIIEKTFTSLPSLISGGVSGKVQNVSRAFQNFIKNLGNVKSKQEEEQLVKRELSVLKQKISQPGVSPAQTRECLVRTLYCHMLGYDVNFAYIYAVKLAQQGSLLEKRAGYLLCGLFLHENHELVMLLVNTIQKDLQSTNILGNCMALTVSSQLLGPEMIPALLPLVEEKLSHAKEIVRKRAVICLHSFHRKAPDLLQHVHHHFQKALCDPDPGVMWGALHVYHDLIRKDPLSYQTLTRTLIGIIEQVLGRHLPADYEYHTVPAPWLQILVLKMLALLGHNCRESSHQMYPILQDILQRTDPSHKIGLAVIYECLETILAIWPRPELVEHAAKCVGKFLSSKNNNLKYLGLKALTSVVRLNPSYAADHQEIVIECLEHEDLTIRRKTLELLYRMANPQNLQVICARLVDHMTSSHDQYLRSDIISKLLDLTERFSQDSRWYIDTVNQVLMLAGDSATPSGVINKVIKQIQGFSTTADEPAAQQYVVKAHWSILLQQDTLPETLIKIATWTLGEYVDLCPDLSAGRVAAVLAELLHRSALSADTCAWILTAIRKLVQYNQPPPGVLGIIKQVIGKYDDTDLHQRLRELEQCSKQNNHIKVPVKHDTQEQFQFDFTLSFLDDYVCASLEQGARPYLPLGFRQMNLQPAAKVSENNSLFVGLNFNPYEAPKVTSIYGGSSIYSKDKMDASPGDSKSSEAASRGRDKPSEAGLQLKGVKKVWGKEGLVTQGEEQKIQHQMSPEAASEKHLQETSHSHDLPDRTLHQDKLEGGQQEESELQKEQNRKKALASALFSGITSQQKPKKLLHSQSLTQRTAPGGHNEHGKAYSHSSEHQLPSDRIQGSSDRIQGSSDRIQLSSDRIQGSSDRIQESTNQISKSLGSHTVFASMDSERDSDANLTNSNNQVSARPTSMSGSSGSGNTKGSLYEDFNIADYVDVATPEALKGFRTSETMLLAADSLKSPTEGYLPSDNLPVMEQITDTDFVNIYNSSNRFDKGAKHIYDETISIKPAPGTTLPVSSGNDDENTPQSGTIDVECQTSMGDNETVPSSEGIDAIEQESLCQTPDVLCLSTDSLEGELDNENDDDTEEDEHNLSTMTLTPGTHDTGNSKQSDQEGGPSGPPQNDTSSGPGGPDGGSVSSQSPNPADPVSILPETLEDVPHQTHASLVLDSRVVQVLSQKVWHPDHLLLLVQVKTGPSSPAAPGAQLHMDMAKAEQEGLHIQVEGQAEPSSYTSLTDLTSPAGQHTTRLRVTCSLPGSAVGLQVWLVLSSQAGEDKKFIISLSLTDFLRPESVGLADFAECWMLCKHEQQFDLERPSSWVTLEAAVDSLVQDLQLACCQLIGDEALFHGKLVGSGDVWLLHCSQNKAAQLTFNIKSNNKELLDAIVKHIQKYRE